MQIISPINFTKDHSMKLTKLHGCNAPLTLISNMQCRTKSDKNTLMTQFSELVLVTNLQSDHVLRRVLGDISNCISNLDNKFCSVGISILCISFANFLDKFHIVFHIVYHQ